MNREQLTMSNEKGKQREDGKVKREKEKIRHYLLLVLYFSFIIGCENGDKTVLSQSVVFPFASFRDIPGVTVEEITAIEELQRQNNAFIYGTTPNSESFIGDDGKVHGFTALLCDWMADIFDVPFKPVIYTWGDLVGGLETNEIDFTGELTPTEERRETYFMTSTIAERTIKYFRIQDSPLFEEIARSRPLRYAFLIGTTTWKAVIASFSNLDYETVFVDDSSLIYDMLKSGEIDAFFNEGPGEYIFDVHGDVVSHSFVPLIIESVSLSTHNAALAPIISVMQKAIIDRGRHYLSQLYNQGYLDYQKHILNKRLTAEERTYLKNNSSIRLAAEYDAYPVSFYNTYEKEWQGIAFDVIHKIEQLTGLKVELANGRYTEWPELLEMLRNDEAAMITELLRIDNQVGLYVWPDNIFITDNFALLSKSEYPNLSLNDIMSARVALRKDTAYAELFHKWFPDHVSYFEYTSHAQAFDALVKGVVDVVMSDRKELLFLSNYNELPGYKVNLVFDRLAETTFGFNANEGILADIIDKALMLIDVVSISSNWIYKTYDYKAKLLEAQRPWLFGAIGLSFTVIVLILILFYRSFNEEKRLEKVVAEKTSFIKTILDTIPDFIFRVDLKSYFTEFNASMEKHFNIRRQDILGKDAYSLGIHPDLATQDMVMNKQVFDEKKTIVYEEIIQSHDGKLSIFETVKTPVIQDGKITGLVGMARDITMRKNAEEEARKASEEAKNASEAKSRFIANMNHEMRTPMNVIIGLTDLLLEEEGISAKIKGTLKNISTASNNLMGLISNVLDISKVETGKMELMPDSEKKKLERADLSYARVLVVDDFPTNLDVAAGMLRKYKMQVDCILSGQEAVDRITAEEPVYDAVFMDHMMPGMDGIETTVAIRALGTKYAENIPIIAFTANVVAGNEHMFLDNGFSAFLPKPFNKMILDSVIQQWVRDRSRE